MQAILRHNLVSPSWINWDHFSFSGFYGFLIFLDGLIICRVYFAILLNLARVGLKL